MPSHLLDHLNAVWLVALFLCLGLAPGTVMTSALRVPRYFWTPLVLGSASLIGYAIFWAYFFFPVNARLLSAAVVIVSAAWFAIVMTSKQHRETLRDRDAWLPIVLSAMLMVAYQGYVLWASVTPEVRFTVGLLPDNVFPLYFANRLFNGLYTASRAPAPFTALLLEGTSSDRPPLQAGIVLAVRALGLGRGLTVSLWSYGVLGAVCQLGWIPALYALGRVLRLSRRQFTYVFVGCAFSGFFLMNSVFVWPKLYSAWLFITGLALGLYLIREPHTRRRVAVAATAGAFLALAMLAHGGVFFSIAALPILLLNRQVRRGLRVRELLPAALIGFLLMAPWMAYQRFYDPPGNRLTKLHLAGVAMGNDSLGTLEAMRQAYAALSIGEILHTRWLNLKEQGLVLDVSGRDHISDWIQWQQFFHSGPALGFLLIGFGALFSRRLRHATEPEWAVTPGLSAPRVAGLMQVTWLAGFALVVWLLLMFVPRYAAIHHGSYATLTLLFFCAAAYLALMPAWVRRTALALNLALFAVGWLAMRTLHVLQPEVAAPKWCWWAAVLMAAAFGGFGLALRLVPEPDVAPLTYPIAGATARMRATSADAARAAEPDSSPKT